MNRSGFFAGEVTAADGPSVCVLDATRRLLGPLEHVVHHSPTGFAWGYGGSGPADLALSMAAHVIGDEGESVTIWRGRCGRRAWDVHQDLKWNLVAGFASHGFLIELAEVATAIELIERSRHG